MQFFLIIISHEELVCPSTSQTNLNDIKNKLWFFISAYNVSGRNIS